MGEERERENGANDAEPEHAFCAPLPLSHPHGRRGEASARAEGIGFGEADRAGGPPRRALLGSSLSIPSRFRGRRGGLWAGLVFDPAPPDQQGSRADPRPAAVAALAPELSLIRRTDHYIILVLHPHP